MSLRERIAACLKWTVQDTYGFSLESLREMVRPVDRGLAQEVSSIIYSGKHITGQI